MSISRFRRGGVLKFSKSGSFGVFSQPTSFLHLSSGAFVLAKLLFPFPPCLTLRSATCRRRPSTATLTLHLQSRSLQQKSSHQVDVWV